MDNYDDILSGFDFNDNENDHTSDEDYVQEPDESYEGNVYENLDPHIKEDARAEEELLRGLEIDISGVLTEERAKDASLRIDEDDDDNDDDNDDDGDYVDDENGSLNKSTPREVKEENPFLWSFTSKELTGNPSDVLDQNTALQEVLKSEINKLRARINQNMKMQQRLAKVLKQGSGIKITGRQRGFSFFPSFHKDVN